MPVPGTCGDYDGWTSGIQVLGASRLAIEGCRIEHNVNYGIEVLDTAKVQSAVVATGFRLNPDTGDFPTTSQPNPGIGIDFAAGTSGTICRTEVSGSFAKGIDGPRRNVTLSDLCLFDNKYNP